MGGNFFFCFVFFSGWGGGGAKWSDLLKTLEGEGLNHNILYWSTDRGTETRADQVLHVHRAVHVVL